MQKQTSILPLFLNIDSAYDKLRGDETPFVKGITWDINDNPEQGIGTNNSSGEGQNLYTLTPVRSNQKFPDTLKPAGYNKGLGYFESVSTQELYYCNFNENGNHGIYVIDGNQNKWRKVIEDPRLNFSDDQKHFLQGHRLSLRTILNKNGDVIEKILMITDGKNWQRWILVNTAIATNGFDPNLFGYFKAQPPHFDRDELLDWAVRPCMIKPLATTVPNTPADAGKKNNLSDVAVQFAAAYNYIDGRPTTLSPYSTPLIVNSSDFLNSADTLPKNARVIIYGGGTLVESVDIYVRESARQQSGIASTVTWSDWKLYDRVYKFGSDPNVLETRFWERTNPWAVNNYDPVFNTLEYLFDNSRLGLVPLIDAQALENDMPQISVAHTSLGDEEALANNRYGYNNLSKQQADAISIAVKEKPSTLCKTELAKITVYGYVGMCDTNFSYISQVGYFLGDDATVRFGGVRPASLFTDQTRAQVDVAESKFFGLDLGGKKCFRLYAKGTPYFADGKWVQVNTDNSIVEIPDTLDLANADSLEFVQNVLKAGGYFAIKWELRVPRGRYQLAVGRHSVAATADYRSTSTYVYGIANSRVKSNTLLSIPFTPLNLTSLKPNSIVTFSKEMAIDCSAGDVDVWGNGGDTFYIYCPYNHSSSGAGNFRFIEGYLEESPSSPLPVELFDYAMTRSNGDDWGKFTDKNGFYWAYTKAHDSALTDISVSAKLNCVPATFNIPTSHVGDGWCQNKTAYVSENNSGVFGDCNRVIYSGRITSLDGTTGYSNIAISIKDGSTVYTRSDGTFDLIIHNGSANPRVSPVYVNAGGNFSITIAGCGQVPPFLFDETLIPCVQCIVRRYPIALNLGVNAQGTSQRSLKESASYTIGLATADLAGRLSYPTPISNIRVPSFSSRGDVLATFFNASVGAGGLKLEPDAKWAGFYVSKQLNFLRYTDWVGDKLKYIDASGNIVNDPASAVLCAIYIDSFYNNNVANNFSILAKYQAQAGDRVRILDDGDGNLFDVATFGEEIDLQVLGTNYNQAAINAGILPNQNNPVVNVNNSTLVTSIVIYVRYDSRLDKLLNKTGFWIELYAEEKTTDKIPLSEVEWFPVINGEIARFTGYDNNGAPQYQYPLSIDLDYWDTYLFSRNISIPDVGDKYFNHPFNSPNVSDQWGAYLTSGGRQNAANPNARQLWYTGDVIPSEKFTTGSYVNGLGTFKGARRKDYSYNPIGGIVFIKAARGLIFFGCENDYFTVDYQLPTARVSNGQIIANPDSGLSMPHPKIGSNFGCRYEDTGTVVMVNENIFWFDSKNTGFIQSNYQSAFDITQQEESKGERGGLQAYINEKVYQIERWNLTHDNKDSFDIIAGCDDERGHLYLSFRPRRSNSNDPDSYVNDRRMFSPLHQETFVYSVQYRGWLYLHPAVPEAWGRLRGNTANVELFGSAGGDPYIFNNSLTTSFSVFFGVQTEPVISVVTNEDGALVKILQAISQDINGAKFFVDMVYSTQPSTLSYIPENYFQQKQKNAFSEVLRDMSSYLRPGTIDAFRSTLHDGKRVFGEYFVTRFVMRQEDLGKYFQLKSLNTSYTDSTTQKA